MISYHSNVKGIDQLPPNLMQLSQINPVGKGGREHSSLLMAHDTADNLFSIQTNHQDDGAIDITNRDYFRDLKES